MPNITTSSPMSRRALSTAVGTDSLSINLGLHESYSYKEKGYGRINVEVIYSTLVNSTDKDLVTILMECPRTKDILSQSIIWDITDPDHTEKIITFVKETFDKFYEMYVEEE